MVCAFLRFKLDNCIHSYCVGNVAFVIALVNNMISTLRDYFCTFIHLESGKRKIAVRSASPECDV